MLLLEGVLQLFGEDLNNQIALREPGRKKLELVDTIRWLAVSFISSHAEVTFDKAHEEITLRDCKVPSPEKIVHGYTRHGIYTI